MRSGYYRQNPLHALKHDYFKPLMTKHEVVLENRNNYVYKPSKDCSCKENKKLGILQRPKRKPCKKGIKPSSNTEDGVNEGQIIVARMFGEGDDKRRKDGDPVPPLDQDVVSSTKSLEPPSAHSPMTPWIVSQMNGTVSIQWHKYKNSELYNFMMDGVSVYTGGNTGVTLDGLKSKKCYRFQVAAFGSTGWSSMSHPLHVNDCALRED
jgi:hypothetical protein